HRLLIPRPTYKWGRQREGGARHWKKSCRRSERITPDGSLNGDPTGLGERFGVGLEAAEPSAGARGSNTAEWGDRLVVDRLVVDVHDAARQPLGQLHPPHHVAGEDSERQSVLTAIYDVDELVLR